MKLEDFVTKRNASDSSVPTVATKTAELDNNIEKLATYLEAFAAEDTMMDQLAKLAVVADLLEAKHGKERNP